MLSHVWLFVTLWAAARQASLFITNSWSLLKHKSIDSVMSSNQLIPFSSCLQFFPASGSFLRSQFFASGGQSIGSSALASVFPMNIQERFPLGLTGLISLQSKGLSRIFSNTSKASILQCSAFYGPTLTSIYDYWKNHSFFSNCIFCIF